MTTVEKLKLKQTLILTNIYISFDKKRRKIKIKMLKNTLDHAAEDDDKNIRDIATFLENELWLANSKFVDSFESIPINGSISKQFDGRIDKMSRDRDEDETEWRISDEPSDRWHVSKQWGRWA